VSPGEDELRPVTALFADVVGSTALGERLGPNEVKVLVGEFVSLMSRAVEEFGGLVTSIMGDGICAVWGSQRAHEDDHERAARSALRIVELVGGYARDVEAAWGIEGFNVRVGINSGQAAVGLVGAGARQEVVLGDVVNVAARLQSAADPGTILVGRSVVDLLSRRFALEALGPLEIKGRVEPVEAWRLLRPERPDRGARAGPIVGRDAELACLAAAVDELEAGRGQIVVVSGEAGIGKTRLLGQLRRVAEERVTWLEGECRSYGGDLLYSTFVAMLRGWLGIEEREPSVVVRTKLRARLGTELEPALPALGRLLGVRLDPEADQRLDALPADALATELRGAYRAWLESLLAERPVVVAIEDVHWADPSTRDLAEALFALTDIAGLLVVITLRPDPGSEGWQLRLRALAEYSHRTLELPLGPLGDDATRELLRILLPGALDDVAQDEIVRRAEGNPLYVEELLHVLVEGGGLVRERTWTLRAGAAQLLPPALELLLVSRIDRLPEDARRVAQVAAVAGRSFPVRVVQDVLGADEVTAALPPLLRAEIVRELRRYPELECTFRHGLLQEAALATLTPDRRRELTGRVARAYETEYAGSLDEHLEQLAALYGQADELGKAHEYLLRAAERAASLDAGEQAEELRRRAAKVATRMSEPT
jgi:class 3 adenylate cyclase